MAGRCCCRSRKQPNNLGISYGSLYELMNRGEVDYMHIGHDVSSAVTPWPSSSKPIPGLATTRTGPTDRWTLARDQSLNSAALVSGAECAARPGYSARTYRLMRSQLLFGSF